MTRREFLAAAGASAGILTQLTTWPAERAATVRIAEDELLAQARARIDEHRKGNGVVAVRGQGGKPVPGARIKISQLRHEFRFGSNLFMFGRIQPPELEEQYRQRFAALLNFATLGFYWGAYEPNRGQPNYEYTGKVIAWCAEQGITCKGHPLAWDHPASSPRWLPEDLTEVQQLSTNRVRDIINRFKGHIDIWDIVNEPTDLTRFKNTMNVWAKQLGSIPYTKLHLNVARAANPHSTLLVNDYRTDPAFFLILDALREGGKLLFDAVGIQSHMHGGGWPLAKIWEVCDRFAKLGVPLHYTETTMVSGPRKGPGENWDATTPEGEEKQAEYVPKFYTMLFAHPATQALTWWDFSDRGAWQGAAAGWLRKDMSPKPVYEKLMALINGDWWTKLEGQTNERGEFAARAFFGKQRITAELPGGGTVSQDVQWERGKENRVSLVVA